MANHYVRFEHHCWTHHCRIYDNRQWCTFTIGYELENEKMIGAGLKPAVKYHITAVLWLEQTIFWRSLITAGWSHKPTVMSSITVGFSQESTMISLQHKRLQPSSSSSSLSSQEQRRAFGPFSLLLRLLFTMKLALGFWRIAYLFL